MLLDASYDSILGHDVQGTGTPVVLLHGLTFDRSSWRPVFDRVGRQARTVALDLPGHGQSPGPPMRMERLSEVVHHTLQALDVDRPVIVGHSMFGALALTYAATQPVRGAVTVDNPLDVRPFARLVRQLEPALRSDAFAETFQRVFQTSMRLDLLDPAVRARVLCGQRIRPDLVLGYWAELLDTDPEALQTRIDRLITTIQAPVLALFGHDVSPSDRTRLNTIPHADVEEWTGFGHFVQLVDPDRFASLLMAFTARCDAPMSQIEGALQGVERDMLSNDPARSRAQSGQKARQQIVARTPGQLDS